VAEVEAVARNALSEVRDAVSGYRQPTLDGELAGARMALSAAGIEASVQRPELRIDPATEAVLAWAVREGATNVIRHSGATHCELKISTGVGATTLEVIDDGGGCPDIVCDSANGNGAGPAGAGAGGHGLAGLAERARILAGRVEANRLPDGGFRLTVQVPSAGGVVPAQ
jgi:two-component system sensor histidine kinase DesK